MRLASCVLALAITGLACSKSNGTSRADAIRAVESAVAKTGSIDDVFIFGTEQPLVAGDQVSSALGDANGDLESPFTVAKPSWFFFVDPRNTLRFQHPVTYYFVEVQGGTMTNRDASAWPAINGLNRFAEYDAELGTMSVVRTPMGVTATRASSLATSGAGLDPADSPGKTYALLVQGSDEGALTKDIDNVKSMFGPGLPATVSMVVQTSTQPAADVVAKFGAICKMAGPKDTVFVYVTSHGTEAGFQQLWKTDPKNGTPSSNVDKLLLSRLDLAGCGACRIIIVVDACYSGALLGSRAPISMIARLTAALAAGKDVTLMTAADATHESSAINMWNTRYRIAGWGVGGAFTQSLVKAINVQTSLDVRAAFDSAKNATNGSHFGDISAQNPQIWPPPGTPPGPGPCTDAGVADAPAASDAEIAEAGSVDGACLLGLCELDAGVCPNDGGVAPICATTCCYQGQSYVSSGGPVECCVGDRFLILDPGNQTTGTGRVKDTSTGLTWMRIYQDNRTWPDAKTFCSNAGMRLPTKDEALGIAGMNYDFCAWGNSSVESTWNTWTSLEQPTGQAAWGVNANGTSGLGMEGYAVWGALCVQ